MRGLWAALLFLSASSANAEVVWTVYPALRPGIKAFWRQKPGPEPQRVLVLTHLPAHDVVHVVFTASGPGAELVRWTPGAGEFAHEEDRLELRWTSTQPFELTSVQIQIAAEHKSIDISGAISRRGTRRAVIFAGTRSLASHGFLIFERENPRRRQTEVSAYGFYPADDVSFSRLVTLRPVPGEVRDELGQRKWSHTQDRLVVFVNARQFKAAQDVIARWRCRARYRLLRQDCVSMTREVAAALGLETPDRGWMRARPSDYIQKLIDVN